MTGDCVFCAVIAGSVPGSFVYEDDRVVAFLDLFPVHAGHTLVVPRSHVPNLVECSAEVAGHLFAVSRRLAPAVVAASGAAGFNVWTANGRVAGQQVFHLHLHILPRFEDDTFGLRFPQSYPQEARREDLEAMAATIRRMVR